MHLECLVVTIIMNESIVRKLCEGKSKIDSYMIHLEDQLQGLMCLVLQE